VQVQHEPKQGACGQKKYGRDALLDVRAGFREILGRHEGGGDWAARKQALQATVIRQPAALENVWDGNLVPVQQHDGRGSNQA
jgi:hypothetical protein